MISKKAHQLVGLFLCFKRKAPDLNQGLLPLTNHYSVAAAIVEL